ncbi:hypothetical protein ISO73_02640 [Morganella morganii subsp. morganii]|uniref:hypothetical protein n=1 Tax=Morganella morganii TaxID=582 RepID=UPI001BA77476|nr:hypothetical protein [Morganella morganii]ELA8471739.1 hypothetical protein [Morganella morganii]MBT0449165.1 hypothetical protein [Morganella morganii subsp. morganii]MBT0507319.1 hypothetical protein [Morganella morganii subsp. morganii]MDT5423193.1 hypothetical protein [Morganella morganii]QUI28274.1 hypothetical protein H4431_03775 [Morganella morganii]
MSTTKKKSTTSTPTDTENINDANLVETDNTEKKKTCFVIMPIADHLDYDKGHFNRVYEYLIKPACNAVGYEAVRADDSKASHMIMFDILKKIVECDMAICDLSTKNANVFYELGLRQAFNKKTILITDGNEDTPFDINGFRYVKYSPRLRIDECSIDIAKITDMLNETIAAPDNDVNSIVKLLEIEPAKITKKELNKEESALFPLLVEMNNKLTSLSNEVNQEKIMPRIVEGAAYFTTEKLINHGSIKFKDTTLDKIINEKKTNPLHLEYTMNGDYLGKLIKINNSDLIFRTDNSLFDNRINNTPENLSKIYLKIK